MGINPAPHWDIEGNHDRDALVCIREMMQMYDAMAERAFNGSNELSDPPKCRVCRRQGLVHGLEINYRTYQAKADILKWVLRELEEGCQSW